MDFRPFSKAFAAMSLAVLPTFPPSVLVSNCMDLKFSNAFARAWIYAVDAPAAFAIATIWFTSSVVSMVMLFTSILEMASAVR